MQQSELLRHRTGRHRSTRVYTYFRSVIVFGKIRIISDESEKLDAINKLAIKYYPDESAEARRREIEREFPDLCILEFTIEHLSGKQAIELCGKTR